MPLKEAADAAAGPHPISKFVLLGEDDIDDEELLKEVFTIVDDSFKLLFVNNGNKVIAALQALETDQLPCLIILDYNMPTLNGAEILQELKRHNRYDSIPKIIWSTSNSTTYKENCLQLGACDYITKPSNMQDLQEVARYMLSFCAVH